MRGLVFYADYFVIATGESTQQVKTIAGNVEDGLSVLGVKKLGQEGLSNAQWVLLDYGDILVHVFLREAREYYELEKLWLDAPTIAIED